MTGAQDTKRRRKGRTVLVPALVTALSLVLAICCSALVGVLGYVLGMLSILSAGGVMGDPELAQSYQDAGVFIWGAAGALALAPWAVVIALVPAV